MSYILLNDPASQRQRVVRIEHISAIEINKSDQLVTLFLAGGQDLHLTPEESRQFVHETKGKWQTAI